MAESITPSSQYDAIIIGAGHNGLVCANYLARAGKKVAVLERRNIVGGAAVTEEIADGYRASIYNALPIESIETLVDCMKEFERKA